MAGLSVNVLDEGMTGSSDSTGYVTSVGCSIHNTAAGLPGDNQRTRFVAKTNLPTDHGTFLVYAYHHTMNGKVTDPIAITFGSVEGGQNVPVRVHDACWTSEALLSRKCDCKQQLDLALDYIRHHGGIVLYLHQEGRGIGLANKIAAYWMQEQGRDTVQANRDLGLPDDSREYTAVRDILDHLGVQSIQLMTNNPRKEKELESLGVVVAGLLPCIVEDVRPEAEKYLQVKATQMGHRLFHQLDGIAGMSKVGATPVLSDTSQGFAADILAHLGLQNINLMITAPEKGRHGAIGVASPVLVLMAVVALVFWGITLQEVAQLWRPSIKPQQ